MLDHAENNEQDIWDVFKGRRLAHLIGQILISVA
jgi:hypothetical protein